MKNQGRWIGLIAVFLWGWLVGASGQAAMPEHVAGEYIVKMKPSVGAMSAGQLAPMMSQLNVQMKKQISKSHHTIVVKKSILERPESVIQELSSHPMVELVEPNYIYHTSSLPNDVRFGDLWGLKNKNKASGGVDIDAEKAWQITTGSKDIVVAVIDTGVNYNHPDLKNNMWVNEPEANGVRGVDDDGNGFVDDVYGFDFANNDPDPVDDHYHGSHCAGTIGAEGDNTEGVVGVNWNVSIMALKFMTANGGGTLEGALQAIDYATQMGADVMNNSWGGGGESQALREAIERAEKAGILFVAAAGNNRNNNDLAPMYPASYKTPNVVSVAAVDQRGRLASFSNYGQRSVHIAAPGVDILSTGKTGYLEINGTSMAAPHVAGVAALLLAKEPSLTYQDLKSRILDTSEKLVSIKNKVVHGFLNANNALLNKIPPPDPDDPSHWPSQNQVASTDHPYDNDTDQTFTLSVPGATRVAVHFEKFKTERMFDKAIFFDKNGKKYGEMAGHHPDSYSPAVEGDTIVVQFQADYSVTDYGFDIDRVHYEGEQKASWRVVRDAVSTDHPYDHYIDEEVVFEQPGAQEIKVKFGKFETEKNYDFVYFYDGAGTLLARWDGDHSGEFSPTAQGDKIVVRIKTDFSIADYGFDVESVHYKSF